MPDLPRLIAFDADDLAVIAANLQDALVRVGEMAFLPQSKQFAMVAARFDWVRAAAKKGGRPYCERCRTGLHLGVFSRFLAWALIVETRRSFSISWISASRKPSRLRALWSLSSPPAGRCGLRSNASKPKSAILGFAGKLGRRHIIPLTAARTKPDRPSLRTARPNLA